MKAIRTFFVRNKKALIVSVLIAEAIGFLSGFLTRNSTDLYQELVQPPLSPPPWVFPVVWVILYFLMGVAAYRIYLLNRPDKKAALWVYALQLVFNFFWPLFFFNGGWFGFSAIWLAALLVLVLSTFGWFFMLDRPAAFLLIPYIIWLVFALYLNVGIWILN